MTKFYKYLNEASLTTADLEKPIDGYKNRGQVLLRKLKNKEAFDMSDGTKEILYISHEDLENLEKMVDTGNFKNFSKEITLYKESDNSQTGISKIEKTKEFGSAKGVGGGVVTTELAECAAAILAFHYIKNDFNDRIQQLNYLESLSKNDMKREFEQLSDGFSISTTIEKVVDFLLTNRDWLISSTSSSEAIAVELEPKSSAVFHRGSKVMDDIYEHSSNLLKKVDMRIGKDKWNPGDIWLIDKNSQRYNSLLEAGSIVELNRILIESIKEKEHDVVGISLKKCTKNYPPVKWYNMDKSSEKIDISEIKPGFFVKIPITKSIIIIDTDPPLKLDIRTFQKQINALAAGELQGKEARGGKIGNTAMRKWLEQNVQSVDINKYGKTDILNREGDWFSEDFIYRFFETVQLLKRIDNIDKSGLNKIRTKQDLEDIFHDMYNNHYKNKIYDMASAMSSKIQAMEIAIYSTDDFLQFCYSYASSSIKGVSAPFIKIGK